MEGAPEGCRRSCSPSECAGSTLTKLVAARFSAAVLTHLALQAKSTRNQIGFLISGHRETWGDQ